MHQTSSPSAAQSVSDDLLEAAQAFFPDFTAAEAIAGHPGLVRVTTPTVTGRVRRWPAGILAVDIAFSREVMATASDAGITPVPRLVTPPTTPGDPSLRIGNRHFDVQMWLPRYHAATVGGGVAEPGRPHRHPGRAQSGGLLRGDRRSCASP